MTQNSEMVILHPKEHLDFKKRSLEVALNDMKLTDEEITKIRDSHAIKVFDDKVLGKIPGYKLAKSLLTWNSEVNSEIKNAKKEMLLVNCCDKLNENGKSIDEIKSFITNPTGNTLFNKILQILDDNPPDPELVQHLSSALVYISQSDFEKLFNEHKYALAQIQLMTPHSLTILNDSHNWPDFNPGGCMASGGIITSDWLDSFSQTYISSKQAGNNVKNLIKHCVNELISKRFIIATLPSEKMGKVKLTEIGQTIISYIKG
jgi:hypothetical protein